ncbi:MAG TPA: hypothetical protein VMH86_01385 [Rhizomicrobium sp.]|nr:hypothetical protein [Rhizomicrobium sp.]
MREHARKAAWPAQAVTRALTRPAGALPSLLARDAAAFDLTGIPAATGGGLLSGQPGKDSKDDDPKKDFGDRPYHPDLVLPFHPEKEHLFNFGFNDPPDLADDWIKQRNSPGQKDAELQSFGFGRTKGIKFNFNAGPGKLFE